MEFKKRDGNKGILVNGLQDAQRITGELLVKDKEEYVTTSVIFLVFYSSV